MFHHVHMAFKRVQFCFSCALRIFFFFDIYIFLLCASYHFSKICINCRNLGLEIIFYITGLSLKLQEEIK